MLKPFAASLWTKICFIGLSLKELFEGKHDAGVRKVVSDFYTCLLKNVIRLGGGVNHNIFYPKT